MALHIDIEALLSNQRIESNRIEFKQGWNAPKIYQSICAFANDFDNIGGGYILVGVEEENGTVKRPICGVPDESLDRILKSMVGYNHEISILSYSGPDRSISADALKSAQYLQARRYRNRRLGDFLKELKLSEGRATGIPTIQDELKRNGSPKAIIETDQERSFFLIRIPCHPDFVLRDWSEDINDTINDTINDIVNDTVKQRLAKMLQLLIQNPSLSKKQLALELGISVPTISRDLSLLVEYQVIERKGGRKNGQWVFLSKSVQT